MSSLKRINLRKESLEYRQYIYPTFNVFHNGKRIESHKVLWLVVNKPKQWKSIPVSIKATNYAKQREKKY